MMGDTGGGCHGVGIACAQFPQRITGGAGDKIDVGRVIGRQGVTINALRSLLLAGSAKKGLRCTLEIVEDKEPDKEPNGESDE